LFLIYHNKYWGMLPWDCHFHSTASSSINQSINHALQHLVFFGLQQKANKICQDHKTTYSLRWHIRTLLTAQSNFGCLYICIWIQKLSFYLRYCVLSHIPFYPFSTYVYTYTCTIYNSVAQPQIPQLPADLLKKTGNSLTS
jgi:hypothetical protein